MNKEILKALTAKNLSSSNKYGSLELREFAVEASDSKLLGSKTAFHWTQLDHGKLVYFL